MQLDILGDAFLSRSRIDFNADATSRIKATQEQAIIAAEVQHSIRRGYMLSEIHADLIAPVELRLGKAGLIGPTSLSLIVLTYW